MYRIKKIVLIMLGFLFTMFLICFVIVLAISAFTHKDFSFYIIINNLADAFLYLIGYGESPNFNVLVKHILSIIGVMALSLLSALLTIKLFWRTDVTISKNIALWENDKSERYASVFINNSGRSVCRIQLTIISYTADGYILGKLAHEYTFPVIPQKSFLQIDIPITTVGEDTFLYELLRTIYKENNIDHENKCKLHVMWSFVDSNTGQESIKLQDYTLDKFVYPPYVSGTKLPSAFWNSAPSDTSMKSVFIDWIEQTKYPIPIMLAKSINCIEIRDLPKLNSVSNNDSICLHLNFDNLDENQFIHPFGMACVRYNPPQNWAFYYKYDYYFEFSIVGSEEIKAVQLEIKNTEMEPVIDQEIIVKQTIQYHSIRLINSKLHIDAFKGILEVDFTFFHRNMRSPQGHAMISDCNLVAQPSPQEILS